MRHWQLLQCASHANVRADFGDVELLADHLPPVSFVKRNRVNARMAPESGDPSGLHFLLGELEKASADSAALAVAFDRHPAQLPTARFLGQRDRIQGENRDQSLLPERAGMPSFRQLIFIELALLKSSPVAQLTRPQGEGVVGMNPANLDDQ